MIRVLTLVALAFVGYSLWLSVSALRADRAGDEERANALRVRGVLVRLGVGFGFLFLVLGIVFISEALK